METKVQNFPNQHMASIDAMSKKRVRVPASKSLVVYKGTNCISHATLYAKGIATWCIELHHVDGCYGPIRLVVLNHRTNTFYSAVEVEWDGYEFTTIGGGELPELYHMAESAMAEVDVKIGSFQRWVAHRLGL
jgi:hypothetical protein